MRYQAVKPQESLHIPGEKTVIMIDDLLCILPTNQTDRSKCASCPSVRLPVDWLLFYYCTLKPLRFLRTGCSSHCNQSHLSSPTITPFPAPPPPLPYPPLLPPFSTSLCSFSFSSSSSFSITSSYSISTHSVTCSLSVC